MTPTSYYRGHSIYYDYETEKWYYKDDDKYIKSENRPCTRCGKTPTLNGADYCLRDLEVCDFIKAACCGHGERIGYIALQDGRTFRETVSNDILFKMFRLEHENKKLKEENEQLRKQIQNYEQLISNSYVGIEETLDGFVGKYVIWEDELQKYKNKNEMINNE